MDAVSLCRDDRAAIIASEKLPDAAVPGQLLEIRFAASCFTPCCNIIVYDLTYYYDKDLYSFSMYCTA
jgi:hypothetical protein